MLTTIRAVAAGLAVLAMTNAITWADDDRSSELQELSRQVDRLFEPWDNKNSPGYVVGVMLDGKFVHQRGYGMANIDYDEPISAGSVFHIMSLSKSFVTACVARAMDQGHFAPDDHIRGYIPELHDFEVPVTIRHLLTCRSGLRDYWDGMVLLGREPTDNYSAEDVFDFIQRQKNLIFAPDERWGYSTSDWFLLAMAIERTTGKSLRDFADEQFFQPLGMHDTFFDDRPGAGLPHRADGHSHDGESYIHFRSNNNAVGSAGLKTTLNDMLIWDQFLHDSPLPKRPHLAAFLQDGSLFGNENCLSAFPHETHRGLRRIWYTGAGMGFMAHFVRFPDQHLSIVAFGNHSTNAGWYAMERVLPEIADLYLADEFDEATPPASTNPVAWTDEVHPFELTPEQIQRLKSMSGAYRLPWGDYAEVIMLDGTLAVRRLFEPWAKGRPEKLTALGPNRFRSHRDYLNYELRFEVEADLQAEKNLDERPGVTIRYADGDEQHWTPIEFASPGEDVLKEYAGEYYCDDLESVYQLSAQAGKLFVRYNFGRKRPYRPTIDEQFVPEGERFVIPITFHRDENGHVTHFHAEFDRSGKVTFVKRPLTSP